MALALRRPARNFNDPTEYHEQLAYIPCHCEFEIFRHFRPSVTSDIFDSKWQIYPNRRIGIQIHFRFSSPTILGVVELY